MLRNRSAEMNREKICAEDHCSLFLESSLAGFFIIQNNLFRYVNRTFASMFGYDPDEIIDKLSPIELTAPEDRDLLTKLLTYSAKGKFKEAERIVHGIRKDGEELEIAFRANIIRHRQRHMIVGTTMDRTQVAAEEYRFQRLLSEDIAAYYVTDLHRTIVDCNDSFLRLFGFSSKSEAVGRPFSSLFPAVSLIDNFLQTLREKKRVLNHEAEYVKQDGTRVYVVENAFAELDRDGNLKTIRGYLLDDTARRKIEGQLYQSQKLENLGTLVGGIAHDFNNVLAIISGHTSVVSRAQFDQERFDASVDAIKKATKRGAHVVRQLLTFASKVDLVTESVNTGEIVDEIVTLCRETFSEKITFSIEIQKGLPTIHADPNQLHQVLLNLCVNARDAMPEGGTINISVSRVGRNALSDDFDDVESQEYIQVKVTDTGVGMDGETLNHIFEPFFTTKKHGQGTGLGLSVVYGIIKSHHGFIGVKSRPQRGSTFSIYLPIPLQRIEVADVSKELLETIGGSGETILVVEDEAPIRDFVENTLRYSGYNVLSSSDGLEAAEIFARHESDIDLVLLDMGLPKMSGGELLSILKKLAPELRVIAASGYLEPELKAEIFDQGAIDFLPKPYMASELLKRINRALNQQPE